MAGLLRIDVYSHNFAVSEIQPSVRSYVEGFARKWIQYGFIKEAGRWIRQAIKGFYSITRDRSTLRFHINQFDAFMRHMEQSNIDLTMIDVIRHGMYIPTRVELPVFDKWKPRDYQEPVIDYIVDYNPPLAKFVALQTGQGKAQPLDAPIKVPGGWKNMGEMYVGCPIIAKDGSTTTVIGVYPQGQKEIFKVTFADGRSTECCGEHLWKVYYVNTVPHKRWRIVNTFEMMRLIAMPNPRVYVELIDSEEGEEASLPIDPYVLGVFLGDGCSRSFTPTITTPDESIAEEVARKLPVGVILNKYKSEDRCQSYGIAKDPSEKNEDRFNKFIAILEEFNLNGKYSHEKFIPSIYLHGSKAQRLAVLQGLLDTDGTSGKDSTVTFASSSKQLAEDVQYLVRSLGGIASIRIKHTAYSYQGKIKSGRDAYIVGIRYKKPSELFRLQRKQERTNDNGQYVESLKLRVSSIVPVGIKEAQCISIDHSEKLYVTNDFIVTHNTFCALQAASQLGYRLLIIVRPMYMDKWQEDVMKTYDINFQDMIVVRGASSLLALLEQGAEDDLTAKVILISNKTLQPYIKLYEQFQEQIRDLGYACMPHELCEKLKVGTIIEDEIHQDFHLNFKLFTYTHVPKTISLSATLLSDDDFITQMYETTFPSLSRFHGGELKKYVNATSMLYQIKNPNKLRYQDYSRKTYSHTMFEESVMKNQYLLANYLRMIGDLIEEYWLSNEYKLGDRCLVYCARIEFCTVVVDYLKKRYSSKDVRRYVEDDPYENIMTADLSVSTPGSAGTGLDIPNLTTVLLTVAMTSSPGNIQGFGRLRDLAPKRTKFIYLTCDDITKHRDYNDRKRVLLTERALTFNELKYPRVL